MIQYQKLRIDFRCKLSLKVVSLRSIAFLANAGNSVGLSAHSPSSDRYAFDAALDKLTYNLGRNHAPSSSTLMRVEISFCYCCERVLVHAPQDPELSLGLRRCFVQVA